MMKVHPRGFHSIARLAICSAMIGLVSLLNGPDLCAQCAEVHSFGPSIAGRTYALALDPEYPNVIYQGGDVNGVYRSQDFGQHWELWSQGLESEDLTSSFYVDDLLVVPNNTGADASHVGIYAATLGGIYFRARNGTCWTLMTGYSQSLDYHYHRLDEGTRKGFPVPFCALIYDAATHTVYAGAGNARYQDGAIQNPAIYDDYSYPGLTTQFDDNSDGVHAQYVVWSINVGSPGGMWAHEENDGFSFPTGLSRQFAILDSDTGRRLAIATSNGIYVRSIDGSGPLAWEQVADRASKNISDWEWSGFVWGIGAGANGRLYALTRIASATTGSKPAGIWFQDFSSIGDDAWHNLDGGSQLVPPFDSHYSPYAGFNYTFKDLLGIVPPNQIDLCTITVKPGIDVAHDELFVGSVGGTSYGGYFRYGQFDRQGATAVEHVTGWIQYAYFNPRTFDHFVYHSIDWHASPLADRVLYSPTGENHLGWLTNNSMNSFVPLVCDASGDRMVMDLYHMPLRSLDGGSTWEQVNCSGTANSWTGNGMNLDTTNDITIRGDGRMVISTGDFGVFEEAAAGSRAFAWTTWHSNIQYTYGDLEIVPTGSGEELYGARLAWDPPTGLTMSRLMKRNSSAPPGAPDEWTELFRFVDGVTRIADIQAYGEDKIFLALRAAWAPTTGGIVSCARAANREFDAPQPVAGLDAGNYTSLARIPGTRFVLAARTNQLVCFDAENPNDHQIWLSNSDADQVLRRAAAGVYKVWVDRLGRVAYVGTKGHNQPGAVGMNQAIGTIIRFEGPFLSTVRPSPEKTAVLANSSASDHPFGLGVAQFGCEGHDSESNERYTFATSFATDANNPRRVYVGLGVPSFDYQSNLHPKNGVWLYDAENPTSEGSAWRQVFGAVGSPSWGANRPVTVLTDDPANSTTPGVGTGKLYVGTDGQGPFWIPVDVTAPPSIANMAGAPIWSTGQPTPTTITVRIDHPMDLAMSKVELYLDGVGGSGYVEMSDDDRFGTDQVAGDNVYTSASFTSDLQPGKYAVRVFAQATDGGYDQQMVTVDVVPYAAKFVNVSTEAQLGLNFAGTPYAGNAFDCDGDEMKDLLISQIDNQAIFFREYDVSSAGIPNFNIVPPLGIGHWRGIASADYDNDGDTDFFLAGEASSLLWENSGSGFTGADVTTDAGLAALTHDATAACWGDYDRDGWLDLYVVRSTSSANPPTCASVSSLQHRLFRNCKGEGGWFVDVTASSGLVQAPVVASLSASWVDVDLDGDLDLFVARAPLDSESFKGPCPPTGPSSLLFINQDNGTFVEDGKARFSEYLTGISTATWADLNNDGYQDLVLGMEAYGIRAYLNDGTGHFNNGLVVVRDNNEGYSGVTVVDHNLDGWLDIVAGPAATGQSPHLYVNSPSPSGRTFVDRTAVAGLSGQQSALGMLAADFTGDGDAELFAAMPAAGTASHFFYKTDSQNGTYTLGKPYVKIRLDSPWGANNREGIGAQVIVVAGSNEQVRVVDGGSGRGGQEDRELIFGLGDYVGPVTAKVTWPSGWYENGIPLTVSVGTTETVNVITDHSLPVISNVQVTSMVNPTFGTLDWTFSWETDASGDGAMDEVQLEATTGTYCWPSWTSITVNSPDVQHVYGAKAGGGYRHSLTVPDQDCLANCRFRYRVASGAGPNKAYGQWYNKRVLVCPSQF